MHRREATGSVWPAKDASHHIYVHKILVMIVMVNMSGHFAFDSFKVVCGRKRMFWKIVSLTAYILARYMNDCEHLLILGLERKSGSNKLLVYLRQGGICFRQGLFVCQQHNSKSFLRILMKLSENVRNGSRKKWLDFGGDPDTDTVVGYRRSIPVLIWVLPGEHEGEIRHWLDT